MTGPLGTGRDPYRQAQLAARAAENQLRLRALGNLDKALMSYVDGLTSALVKLPKTELARATALRRSVAITGSLRAGLRDQMERAVATGRAAAFDEVLRLQQQATLALGASEGIPGRFLGSIIVPKVTMAGVWESLGTGSATWKTLLRGYTEDAVADAQAVVTQALISGMSPDELSRRLRPYVTGSESFQEAFRATGVIDDALLRASPIKGAARRLRFNADRIAFSEIHNARSEAELQAFAADPFVKAVRWTLSPNRGTLRRRDACDGLARTNWYGMGPGIFPISKVPPPPHPFDRCERVPVTRGRKDAHLPKPNPPRQVVSAVLGTGCVD